MKESVIMVAVAGLVLAAGYYLTRKPEYAKFTGGQGSDTGPARLVATWDGWKYYSDGTAIAPDGDYFHKGAEVFDA